MKIKGVDFSEHLLNAQREGSLVVFAGAGVSMGTPSNYPNFKGLAKDIAKWAGVEWPEEEPIEYFLGRLVHKKIKVHERVAALLSLPESKPKELHKNLLKIFGSPDQIRIVTTNFDSHFETAAAEVLDKIPEIFKSPALPLGHDFCGLVYLHGSVQDNPKRLILTDQDFGRAYLTEGWATRFLRSLFSSFTVLFIGYSHDDIVMHYLSRGLPPDNTKPRFALVCAVDDLNKWKYRGIEPLAYPFEDEGDHSGLDEAVAGWVDRSHWGALETEQRIKQLVEGPPPPPLDSESQDFLLWAVNDITALRFFVRHTKRPEWLTWLSDRKILEPLFSQDELSEKHKELARWIAETHSTRHPDYVFAITEGHCKTINPWFVYQIICEFAFGAESLSRKTLSRWIPILLQNNTLRGRFEYTEILKKAIKQRAISAAVQLFTYLIKPSLFVEKSFIWPEEYEKSKFKTEVRLDFFADDNDLRDVWEQDIKPRLSEVVFGLWPNLLQIINQIYLLSSSWSRTTHRGDLSRRRAAIEPHEQDRYPHIEDILINATRDCLEFVLQNVPLVGQAWIETLSAMEPMIARRLAVHGVSFSSQMDPNEKIRWLLDKRLLIEASCKHEVFQLLKRAYPGAKLALRKELIRTAIRQIAALPERDEDEENKARKEYNKYNLLFWLSTADPSCEEVKSRLNQIKEKYPDFSPHKYPDLDSWFSDGERVGPLSPVTVKELLNKRPAEWMEYFLNFKGDNFMGPDRDGLLYNIGEAVVQDFDWSKELAELLVVRGDHESDLWRSVIRGWYKAKILDEQWDFVLNTLEKEGDLSLYHPHYISDLLKYGVEKEENKIPLTLFDKADQIALHIWKNLGDDEEHQMHDWLGRALNRPAGALTFFWLYAFSQYHKESGRKGEGLVQPYRDHLDMIMAAKSEAGTLGRVILTSQLDFLYSVDEIWTRDNLIPLLDWNTDVEQAQQAWDGWLSWGRLSEPLLKELIPHYQNAFSYLSSKLKEEGYRLIEHVVIISLYRMNDPVENSWLFEFLRRVEDEDRVSFASQVCSRLMSMSEEIKKELWERWLKRYWVSRNEGVPVPLSDTEIKEMIEWAGELGLVFPEAVEVICKGPVPKIDRVRVFYRMKKKESQISSRYPEALTRFLIHLTKDNDDVRRFCRDLEELTDQAISAGAPTDLLRQLCEQLATIGFNKASELFGKI